jgi:hypothetical protein
VSSTHARHPRFGAARNKYLVGLINVLYIIITGRWREDLPTSVPLSTPGGPSVSCAQSTWICKVTSSMVLRSMTSRAVPDNVKMMAVQATTHMVTEHGDSGSTHMLNWYLKGLHLPYPTCIFQYIFASTLCSPHVVSGNPAWRIRPWTGGYRDRIWLSPSHPSVLAHTFE